MEVNSVINWVHIILKDVQDARTKSYFVQMSKSDKEDRSKNKQHGAENTMLKLCTGGQDEVHLMQLGRHGKFSEEIA